MTVGESDSTAADVPWTTLDREGLVDAYQRVVDPILRADGFDPGTHKPTHDWLRDHDFGTLVYALRTYHDLTFGEFWTDDLGRNETDTGHAWATDDERTVDALDSFLDSRRTRKGLADSSLDTLRYRLDRYVQAYAAANGHTDLVSPVARDGDVPVHEAVDECWAAFDHLHSELGSGRTKRRIHGVVSNWYDHLVRRRWARANPASGLDEEFDWRADADSDPPHLAAEQVRVLYETAADDRERLLVLALCAWGLRSGEVARLHRSNVVLDGDGVAHLRFERRKNGPGQVSLLYGVSHVERRLAALADEDDWAGYLFPSPRADRDHVGRWTVWNWFTDLADRADIEQVAGESPVPQMGRRFWYDAYSSALEQVAAGIEDVAAEQGSSSPAVVLQNYLSEERVRTLRRDHMRERLASAFDGVA
ncbi:tyrosine-type recombinase/integrase [Haloarchaeobius sp. DFWS5]|uniref:tyrosine-type recombinase/integrase n=1 Tax=Haloarchaeobius sp. DFWS5 TaxID=3446114 RepID=UPI003EC03E09